MQSASGASPLLAHYAEYRVNKYLAGARGTKISAAIPTAEPSSLEPIELDHLHDVDEKLSALRVAIMLQQQASMMKAVATLSNQAQTAIMQPTGAGQVLIPGQKASMVTPIMQPPHQLPPRVLSKQHVIQMEMLPTTVVQGTRAAAAGDPLLPRPQLPKEKQKLEKHTSDSDSGSQSPILGSRSKNKSPAKYATSSDGLSSSRDALRSSPPFYAEANIAQNNSYNDDLPMLPACKTVCGDGAADRDVMLDTTILLPPINEREGEVRREAPAHEQQHAFGLHQQAADEARAVTPYQSSDLPASQTMVIPSEEAAEALMLFTNQPLRQMPPLESIPAAQYTTPEPVLLADDGWDPMDMQERADEYEQYAEQPYQPLTSGELLGQDADTDAAMARLTVQETQEPITAESLPDVNAIVLLPLQTTDYTHTISQPMHPQVEGQLRVIDGREVVMALSPKTVPEPSNEKEMTLHATQIRDEIEQTCLPPLSPIPPQRRYLEAAARTAKAPENRSAIGQLWPQDMDSTIGTFTNTAATQPPAAPAVRAAERLPQLRVLPTATVRVRGAASSQDVEAPVGRTSNRIRSTPRSEISSIMEAEPPAPAAKKPKLKPSATLGKLQLQGGVQARAAVKAKEVPKDRSKMFARVPPPPSAARAPALATAVVPPYVAPAYVQSEYSHTQEMELMDVLASSQGRLTRSRTLNALIEVCDATAPLALGNVAAPQRPQFVMNGAAPGNLSPMSAVSVSSVHAYRTADAHQETFVDVDPFFGLALAMEDAVDLAVPSGFNASWTSASHFDSAQPEKPQLNQPVGGDLDSIFSQSGLITPEQAADQPEPQAPAPVHQPELARVEAQPQVNFGGADSPPMDPRHAPLVELVFDYD
jgi:hypothetical protein